MVDGGVIGRHEIPECQSVSVRALPFGSVSACKVCGEAPGKAEAGYRRMHTYAISLSWNSIQTHTTVIFIRLWLVLARGVGAGVLTTR